MVAHFSHPWTGSARDLSSLINPRKIAVVGASPRANSAGGGVMRTLMGLGFTGELYPVNPRYEEVLGHRCYGSLADLPEPADGVFIGLPAEPSLSALHLAGECGIRAAVIHAAGYADAGAAGARLQRELTRVAAAYGIALSGPNNMGVVNVLDRTGMWTMPFDVAPGPVAVISQSGSAAIALTDDPKRLGLGYVMTAGNEAVVDIADYLQFAVGDDRVRIVLMFLESIRSPARFAAAASQAAASGKRIIAIKVGRSPAAEALVRGHTNSIAGSDETYDALLAQCGVIRVRDFDEMLELATLFTAYPDPPDTPTAVAVTMSGGEAALVADLAAAAALPLPSPPRATRQRLRELLGTFSPPRNPIDAWGSGWDAARFRAAMHELATASTIGTIIAVLDAPASGGGDSHIGREVACVFAELRADTARHFVILTTAALSGADPEMAALAAAAGIPVVSGLCPGLEAIARWSAYSPPRAARGVRRRARTRDAFRRLREVLLAGELEPTAGAELLQAAGVPMAPVHTVRSQRDAVQAAKRVGYPVVLKGHGDGILHKHALGLVAVGVLDQAAVRAAHRQLSARLAAVNAQRPVITVQPLEFGLELFVGARNDASFGPVTVVGLGGTQVEAGRAVAIHVGEVDNRTAKALLRHSPAGAVLRGSPGAAGHDLRAAVEAIVRLSALASALNDVVDSIEINPLIARADGRGVAGVDLVVVRKTRPLRNAGRATMRS